MNSSDTNPKVLSFSGGILKVSELVWQSIVIDRYIYMYYDQSLANNCCFDKSLFSVIFAVHLVKAGAAPWVTFQLPTCQDQHGLLLRGRQSGGPSIGAQLEITGAGISIWVCLKIVYPYTQWLMIIIPIFRHTHLYERKGVASVCCLAELWIRLIFQGFVGIEFGSTGILKNGDAVPTHHADAVGIWGSASPSSVEIIRPGHGFRFGCSVWCRYPGFILSRSITVTDSNIQELLFLFVSSVSKLCELWTAAICIFWIAIGVWLKVLTDSFSPIVVLPCASLL